MLYEVITADRWYDEREERLAMAEMTFWDHLDELRKVLFRILGVWFVLAIGYFIAMPWLFDHVILAPCHNDFVFYSLLRSIGESLNLVITSYSIHYTKLYEVVRLVGNRRTVIWHCWLYNGRGMAGVTPMILSFIDASSTSVLPNTSWKRGGIPFVLATSYNFV